MRVFVDSRRDDEIFVEPPSTVNVTILRLLVGECLIESPRYSRKESDDQPIQNFCGWNRIHLSKGVDSLNGSRER